MTKIAVAQAEDRRIAHQPALDGLRAVAVSAVLLYHHVGPNGGIGHGGFLGVDIFFVISGFLITALLIAEHRSSGVIDLRRFWSRRARRLLPALLAMLVLAAFLSRLVYAKSLQPGIHQDVLWTLGYVQNWHIAFFHAQPSPIGHTWSLSVEEQWYLLWPAALWGLLIWTRGRSRRLAWILAGLAGASALWVAYLYASGRGNHAFFGTDARAVELLIGAGLAEMTQSGAWTKPAAERRRTADGAGLVALAALVAVMLVAKAGPTWGQGPLVAISVATALVIAAGVQPAGPVRTILSLAPLVFIGELSYGLYLFHFPVYFWLDAPTVGVSGYPLIAVRVVVTACIAIASFRLLEEPIRRGKFSGYRLACTGAIVAAGVVAATSIGIWSPAPKPKSDLLAYALTNAARTAPPGVTRVLVIGGSAASFLGRSTTKPFDADGIYGTSIGSFGCGLTSETASCRETPDDLAALAAAYRADAVVLMPDAADIDGLSSGPDVAHRAERLVVRLDQMKSEVGGRRVVILEVPCNARPAPPRTEFNRIIRSWAERRDVRIGDSGLAECHGGQAVIAGAGNTWATIGRLVNGRS